MEMVERWFRRFSLTGLRALEVNVLLHELAMGMANTFGAVFIFTLSESAMRGLWYMIAFYGGQRMIALLFVPLVGKWLPRIGYRRMMFYSMFGEVGKLLLYSLVSVSGLLGWLVPAALLGGFYLAGMSMSFQALFVTDNDDKRIGEQAGVVLLFQYAGLVLAPLLGGMLAQWEGFVWLFLVTIGLLVLSMIPLQLMPRHSHRKDGFDIDMMVDLLSRDREYSGSVGLWQLTVAVNEFFWPIYIVMIGHSYAFLGSLKSAIVLASGVSAYVLGRVYDRRPLHRIFPLASVMQAGIWLWRFMVVSVAGLTLSNVIGRLLSPIWWMKIRRYELAIGEKQSSMVYAMAHEILVSVGLIGGLLIGGWVLAISGFYWPLLGLVPATGVLLSAWLVRKR